jgi:hypothetical protein
MNTTDDTPGAQKDDGEPTMSDIHDGPRPLADRDSDEAVERLLRRAGRRPPVPADHAAAVKAAARAQWRWTVRGERRRARFVRAGALLAAAVVVLVVGTTLWRRGAPAPAAPVATLEAATGELRAAGGTELHVGDPIPAGAVLESETGSRALLRLAGGPTVRLDHGTRLHLETASALELEAGAVYLDSGASAAPLEVRTPFGTARDVGTRFEVRLGKGGAPLRVRVREGKVALERAGGSHLAGAGVELAVAADGTVTEGRVPVHGELWDWTLTLLPVYEVEGRSLREFLDWAAAEAGWRLRFAEPSLGERAGEVTLHGTITGLGLEDAVALSLLSSGLDLTYRVEEGILVVERAPPGAVTGRAGTGR